MTEEQLAMVTRMGAAGFTIPEILIVTDLDEETATDEIFIRAYRKGYLTRQLELRERIFKDAKNGSSPAQSAAMKILNDCITKMGGML